jgi:hypothetical protein
MNWLFWLALAVGLTAVVAVTGTQPEGTRPISHTRMMGAGRVVLAALALFFAYVALTGTR